MRSQCSNPRPKWGDAIMIRHLNMRARRWATIMLMVLLSGCMVGPDYQRPAVTTPDSFRGASAAIPPDQQSIGELKWFEVFQDEQLQELIRTALQQNYDLRMRLRASTRRAPTSASLKRISTRTSASGPMFPLASYRGRENLPSPGEPAASAHMVRSSLNLFSFEIDIWGRLRRATEASRADLLRADWTRESGGHDPDQRRGHRLFQPSRTGCGIGDCKEHFSHAFRIASFDQASTARRGEHAFRRATGRATSL